MFLILNFVTYNFGQVLINNTSSLLQYFGNLINQNYITYNFLILILQSVCYFLWFNTLNIKSKFINYISSLTLGIYLIHDHPYLKKMLYSWFNITNSNVLSSKKFILQIIIVAIIIFTISLIIEAIRQLIFKFIRKRKISQKISNKFYNYIDSLQKDA